jgi:hypothetical protein
MVWYPPRTIIRSPETQDDNRLPLPYPRHRIVIICTRLCKVLSIPRERSGVDIVSVVGVLVGIIVGIVSFLPLRAGVRRVRMMDAQSYSAGYVGPALVSVAGSIAILAVCTALCALVARAAILPFVLAEALTLIIVTAAFAVMRARRDRKKD